MKFSEPKELTRADIQKDVKAALKSVVEKHRAEGVNVNSAEYIRRLPRSAVHEAAKVVLDNGGGPGDFRYMAEAAWAKEQGPESLGEAVIVSTPVVDKEFN